MGFLHQNSGLLLHLSATAADYDSMHRISQNPVRLAVLEEKLAHVTNLAMFMLLAFYRCAIFRLENILNIAP